ncbi:hypothetical protein [Anabaena cylindrica]|uniref:hypothetical protein n=1 Tax=Anabaena cylindrica TaxID=1165 RepID=UPI001494422E|nr:hypothetical protein [Anabaena cylindrica]
MLLQHHDSQLSPTSYLLVLSQLLARNANTGAKKSEYTGYTLTKTPSSFSLTVSWKIYIKKSKTMKCIHQISPNSLIQELFGAEKHQYQLRIYLPYPQIQIVVFSKMKAKKGSLTIQEVENLANLVVKEFGLNPNFVVWIEHDFSQCENLSAAAFSLITFDWYRRQAANPRWRTIHENWYLYWLENGNLEYVTV